MHPDLYAVLHAQRERELEQRLARALVLRERTGVAPHESPAGRRSLALRWATTTRSVREAVGQLRPRPAAECCPAAGC
ncbi:hypothetical protein [Cellulomonas alba]|uniref:DUF222 domain-containing protein n=1 Tax=Cellulomonas alba TaxID=3053467 RepID=A0ABT7SCJ1_9CELL|nr:hypothetical protein [Cellulomonas alba]MDM7853908.1 hypothetical protein [Cellulomonas alba]